MQEIKWGLIGCGDIARKRVIPALQNAPGSKLVAVARKNAAKVEECAKEFGVEKWYENPDDLIQDPDIDAVYLATPVFRHMPDILAAAAAGKHVLCEKPLALNPDDCQTIIDVTRKAGITFGVAYYRRFYPSVLAVRNYLTKGSLGHIVNIEFRVNDLHDPTGNWAGREWFFNKALCLSG